MRKQIAQMTHSVYNERSSMHKHHTRRPPKPACLITNLAYRLKQHENSNLYLRARLDTCADVNIMPASVYKLVYKDPNLEKLAPNKMQIGTYSNNTVKIVGTCELYLVHLDTKRLIETTFHVATNDGSMLLSCMSTLDLDLIEPRSRLDYLPPWASLFTSTQDHPKKMRKASPQVHRLQQVATQSEPPSSNAPKQTTTQHQVNHKQGPDNGTIPRCL